MTAGLLAFLHVFSSRKLLQPHAIQCAGVHIYEDKKNISHDLHVELKRKYIEGRGLSWYSSKRKSDRFKDSLNELEALLLVQHVVSISWKSIKTCQVVLSNGVIVNLTMSEEVLDIERIDIDKFFSTKMTSYICNVIYHNSFMVFALLDKSELLLINLSKKTSEKYDEVSFENEVSTVSLPFGPSGMRLKRNMTVNTSCNMLCVWWTYSNEEGTQASLQNYPNIVVLSLIRISNVYSMEISSCFQSSNDLADIQFSYKLKNQILTVEQSHSTTFKYLVYFSIYDASSGKVVKAVSFSLKGHITCVSRNSSQSKVVVMSSCGRLILWDEEKRQKKTVKPSFVCTIVNWHPSDCLFVIANSKGDFQMFDQALIRLSLRLVGEEMCEDVLMLSKFFFTVPKLLYLSWATDDYDSNANDLLPCCSDMLLLFESGPLCVLRFEHGVCASGMLTTVELTCEYIRHQQLPEAVNLLSSMNWDVFGEECFQCLCLIAENSFKDTFQDWVRGGEGVIEDALGSFYAPKQPLNDETIIKFKDDVNRIARKFFNILLRFKRYEKAFLLAVDIGSKDLFMDIHYCALDEGKIDLANASKNRAFLIHNQGDNQVLTIASSTRSHKINDNDDEVTRRLQSTYITRGFPKDPRRVSIPQNENERERKYSSFKKLSTSSTSSSTSSGINEKYFRCENVLSGYSEKTHSDV